MKGLMASQERAQEFPGTSMTLEELDILWEELGNIPLNYGDDGSTLVAIAGIEGSDGAECIDTDFFLWKRGEQKMVIWRWFDDAYAIHSTCLGDRWFSESGRLAGKTKRLEAV